MEDGCAWVAWLLIIKQTGRCIWRVSVSVAGARRQPSWAVFAGAVLSLPHFFALLTKPWIIHQLSYQTNIFATCTCKLLEDQVAAPYGSQYKGRWWCHEVFRLNCISLWCSASLTLMSHDIISILCWICRTLSAFLCCPEMLIQRLYLRLQAAHVPIHEIYIFLEKYLRDETVIYVCITHSKTPHTKIEFDLSCLSSPCIRNNLPQVHTFPFCSMLLCKFHVAKVLKPCLSADRWNLNPGNDATISSTDSSAGLLVTLWWTVWRGLQEARPNAHAHFSSTQTWNPLCRFAHAACECVDGGWHHLLVLWQGTEVTCFNPS